MIVCGDFAYPFESDQLDLNLIPECFLNADKILNFESTLSSLNGEKKTSGIAISSSDIAFDILFKLNFVGVTLSNNHILDFDYDINNFKQKLLLNELKFTGLGVDLHTAGIPMIVNDYVILNFGWHTIGCKSAKSNSAGCNPLSYDNVVNSVKNTLRDIGSLKLVVIFHWNYEFELYPQPAHRCLAKLLIDMGVESVVGHHSHIIQGAELYNGKAIIYGLGNFYLPRYNYNGYDLHFPANAYIGLAVDLTNLNSYIINTVNNKLEISSPIPLFENELINESSSFSGMSDSQYLKFFKKNRIKKKLLPIYDSWGLKMDFNDIFVMSRQFVIDLLVGLKLKRHNR